MEFNRPPSSVLARLKALGTNGETSGDAKVSIKRVLQEKEIADFFRFIREYDMRESALEALKKRMLN